MKNLKLVVISAFMTCCLVLIAQAYYQVTGADEGWSNNDPNWVMYDTNTGVLSFTTTINGAGDHPYKIITQQASWTDAAPGGSNAVFMLPTGTTSTSVTFYFSNLVDTTWSASSAVFWTNMSSVTSGPFQYVAVGMDSWLGDSQDYDPTYAGATMSPIGNGIYQKQIVFSTFNPATAGTKNFKVALNGGWNEQIGADIPPNAGGSWGFNTNADAPTFGAFYQNDTVTLQVDSIRGRLRILHSHPGAAGPPWYCIGDMNGIPGASTQMTNAGGGLYTFSTTPNFSSTSAWFNVLDAAFNKHPSDAPTQGCWYTSVNGTPVTATYDTNTHVDGFLPFTNFVYTSPTTSIGTHSYGLVGTLYSFFSIGAADWDAVSGITTLNDAGVGGDLVAGDLIYSTQLVVVHSVSTFQILNWKEVTDGSYTQQIGVNGRTESGGGPPNNTLNCISGDTIRFEVDINHGRVRATNLTHPTQAYSQPSLTPNNGKPGTQGVLSASGGSGVYISWTSSDTTKVQIAGFAGSTALVNYVAYGSSTVTVHDSYNQTASAVVSVVPTSAPLATESANSYENRNTSLWSIKE